MIDKINKEIKELEREIEDKENWIDNSQVYGGDIDFHGECKELEKLKAKLDQAKKDKEIIEKGLEELYNEITEGEPSQDGDIYSVDVFDIINQKLKNQNGK